MQLCDQISILSICWVLFESLGTVSHLTVGLVKVPTIHIFCLVSYHFLCSWYPLPLSQVAALSSPVSSLLQKVAFKLQVCKVPHCPGYSFGYPFPYRLQGTLGQSDLIKDSVKQSCLSSLQRHPPSLLVFWKGTLPAYPLFSTISGKLTGWNGNTWLLPGWGGNCYSDWIMTILIPPPHLEHMTSWSGFSLPYLLPELRVVGP